MKFLSMGALCAGLLVADCAAPATQSTALGDACGGAGWGKVGGALAGGAAGGLLGNQIGRGSGNGLATAVGALGGIIAGSAIGSHIDDDNCLRAQQRAQTYALTSASVGQPIEWTSTNSQGQPVNGRITPIREGTSGGQPCREFQQTVSIGGQSQQAHGTACREADGSWRIQNSAP